MLQEVKTINKITQVTEMAEAVSKDTHYKLMHHIIRISEQCLQNYKLYMSSRPFLWESMKDFANKISVLQKEEIKMFLNSRQSCRLPIVDSTLC